MDTRISGRVNGLFLGLLLSASVAAQGSILDDYVASPDSSYSYTVVDSIHGGGYTAYILDMTSQTWRDSAEVDRTSWQHWVTVVVPAAVMTDQALLLINGGSNTPNPPGSVDQNLVAASLATNSVSVDLKTVPNQPLTFSDETQPRYEDAIIAYSWNKFLGTGDPIWPVQLPMTNSAVRAMDAVQEFCAGPAGGGITVSGFVVTGGSKRGWTTWLAAAVDPRVSAIIPTVFDALSLSRSFRQHYGSYGFWAAAVHDYEEMGIFDWMGTTEIKVLMDIVDPFSYRQRLTMPKYLIHSTGDEFFVPSSHLYFHELPSEKYQRYVPNTDHSLSQAWDDVTSVMVEFYRSVLQSGDRPQFSWALRDDSIRVQTFDTPTQVLLWQATNLAARDFRYETIGAAWRDSVLTDQGGGEYIAHLPEPETGWTAFFVELTYASGGLYPFKFTTDISIIPDSLPFAVDVPLTVMDRTMGYSNLKVVGSMSDWQRLQAYDDGTHGDTTAGDHSWRAVAPAVLDGVHEWGVLEDDGSENGIWLVEGENPIFSVLDHVISGTTYYETPCAGLNDAVSPVSLFTVYPNTPNPFSTRTTIRYDLPGRSRVSVTIHDIRGKVVRKLTDQVQGAGRHSAIWDGTDISGVPVSTGVYVCRVMAASSIETRKILLLR